MNYLIPFVLGLFVGDYIRLRYEAYRAWRLDRHMSKPSMTRDNLADVRYEMTPLDKFPDINNQDI